MYLKGQKSYEEKIIKNMEKIMKMSKNAIFGKKPVGVKNLIKNDYLGLI